MVRIIALHKWSNNFINQVVIFTHPFNNSIIAAKRVKKQIQDGKLFVEGDNPDPTASDDSHNFGWINLNQLLQLRISGPDRVRTRDRRIKVRRST